MNIIYCFYRFEMFSKLTWTQSIQRAHQFTARCEFMETYGLFKDAMPTEFLTRIKKETCLFELLARTNYRCPVPDNQLTVEQAVQAKMFLMDTYLYNCYGIKLYNVANPLPQPVGSDFFERVPRNVNANV